jgi:peroxiredoxin
MSDLKTGDKAPSFTMQATGGETVSLKDFKGQTLVLYFYPKDDTSGCTAEACDFRDNIAAFKKIGAAVIGVSKDDLKSHEKFARKYDLNFPLASDADGAVCAAYGTWVEKSMYGRKYMGIERATFLIDGSGKIAGVWRKVKVTDHVAEVQDAVKALAKRAA